MPFLRVETEVAAISLCQAGELLLSQAFLAVGMEGEALLPTETDSAALSGASVFGRIASANAEPPRGVAKPGAPAAISVSATPLEHGKMKVAIEFYQDGTGRLRTVTCEGSFTEIDDEVQKLPNRERSLVQAALKRIRDLNTQKPDKPAGKGS